MQRGLPADVAELGGTDPATVPPAPPPPPRAPAGPPPQEQLDATLAWVSDVFREYYRSAPPELPPRYGRREFGFLWNGKKFFLRHTSFSSKEAFHDFLVKEAPHHAYYSTAYYKTPHAATMKEKEWLGADLIFDLDADHLPGGDKMTFAEQLAAVKVQAHKLLHEFILGDFGFDESHVRIVFSGGRGYHFHVNDPRVLQLDSAARREIVDYISPNDIVRESLRPSWIQDKTLYKNDFGQSKKDKVISSGKASGWNGQLTRAAARYLRRLEALPREEAMAELTKFNGIGPATAAEVLKWGFTPDLGGNTIVDKMEKGAAFGIDSRFDSFSNLSFQRETRETMTERMERDGIVLHHALTKESFTNAIFTEATIAAEGETDEPVTADIKRLIRLPGSLHGKTGLRVTPLTIKEFEHFDPLRDAVALGDEPTRIMVSKPTEVPLLGKRLMVQPGEQELPLYAAAFVVLRRAALRPMT